MVLRKYWNIVLKRLWIMLALVVLVALTYLIFYRAPQASYNASMRFTVGITPEQSSGNYYTYDRYYTWLTAEYLIDDLSEVVKSGAFAQDVTQASGLTVPAGAIQGATSAGKLHRILSVSITWPDRVQLEQIANAAVTVLQTRNSAYFKQLDENAVVTLIDPPSINVVGRSLSDRLNLPLRLLIAVVVGLFVVFLLDYLDSSIRDK
ncbi:MAG: YveK family protein, partial [Anaerolineae bacterium]